MAKFRTKCKAILNIALAAILLACVLLASGCSKSYAGELFFFETTKAQLADKRITFVGFKGGAQNVIAIEEAMHGYMNENPSVNITYEYAPAILQNLLERRFESGTLDDVFMLDTRLYQFLRENDALMDLSGINGLDKYQPLMDNQFRESDGKVLFVPTCISTYGMYVNYNLLNAHKLQVPQTYEQFKQVCDYFKAKGITPIIANNDNTLRSVLSAIGFYSLYRNNNPNAEIEKYNSDIPAFVQMMRPAVERLVEMFERKYIDCNLIDNIYPTRLTSGSEVGELSVFLEGKQPFMFTGGWASLRVDAAHPSFSYGIHPFPVMDDGSCLVMDANTCVAVRADSKNPEAAKKFVEYLIKPDVMWRYCDSQSSYTPLVDSRTPSDKAIAPSAPYLTNGRNVIGLDYKWNLPIKEALEACGKRITAAAKSGSINTDDILDVLGNVLSGTGA